MDTNKAKKGNPLGKDTVNVGANIPDAIYDELKELAKQHEIGVSSYARLVLIEAALSGAIITKEERLKVHRTNHFAAPRELVNDSITPGLANEIVRHEAAHRKSLEAQ